MGFLETMKERGLLAQVTHEPELALHLADPQRAPRTAYIGFDPTAKSLHVGSLVPVMTLRRWQQAGHRVVAVVGGGTSLIGDPSGKTDLRQMLTRDQIRANLDGIKAQLAQFVDFSDPRRAIMVDNADWLAPLNYLTVLREIGTHFSVNRMLTAECFRQRLEKGLSFLEFNYMILQAYDFLHLYRAEACTVQLGGDDQWSNMLAGMELVRRLGGAQAFCLTMPLLTTADGKKMGKTEKGAVWLDPALTSPYDYFQYWRNVEDASVGKCLAYFTELPMAEIHALTAAGGASLNQAKVVLAYEATKLAHGAAEADQAKAAAAALFGTGHSDGGPPAPDAFVPRALFVDGPVAIADLLVAAGVVPSKSEARRLIAQGGLVLNGDKVDDGSKPVPAATLEGEGCLVKKGKKHYYRLRFS